MFSAGSYLTALNGMASSAHHRSAPRLVAELQTASQPTSVERPHSLEWKSLSVPSAESAKT